METLSVKEFCASKDITQVAAKVRTNANGYPFVTFINKANVAENVYFSKNAAVEVTDGMIVSKQMLTTHQIGMTVNASGEPRIKLISNSERLDISSLLD